MALTLTNVRGGRPPSEIKLAKPEAHDAPFFTGEFSGVVYQVRVRQQWRRFSLASHVVLTDRNCGQCASLYCGCAWTPKLGAAMPGGASSWMRSEARTCWRNWMTQTLSLEAVRTRGATGRRKGRARRLLVLHDLSYPPAGRRPEHWQIMITALSLALVIAAADAAAFRCRRCSESVVRSRVTVTGGPSAERPGRGSCGPVHGTARRA